VGTWGAKRVVHPAGYATRPRPRVIWWRALSRDFYRAPTFRLHSADTAHRLKDAYSATLSATSVVPAHPTHSPSLTAVAPPPPATVCAASTDDVGEGRTPLFRLVGASFVGDSRCSLRWVCLRSVSPIWAYTPLPLDGWSVRRERIRDFLITPSEKFQFLSGYDF